MAKRQTDMMHFRLDSKTQGRIARAVEDHPERFDNQSSLMRQAIRYYLNRLEAGVLDQEPEPKPPAPDDRRLRSVPPAQRSTEVAG